MDWATSLFPCLASCCCRLSSTRTIWLGFCVGILLLWRSKGTLWSWRMCSSSWLKFGVCVNWARHVDFPPRKTFYFNKTWAFPSWLARISAKTRSTSRLWHHTASWSWSWVSSRPLQYAPANTPPHSRWLTTDLLFATVFHELEWMHNIYASSFTRVTKFGLISLLVLIHSITFHRFNSFLNFVTIAAWDYMMRWIFGKWNCWIAIWL